MVYMDKYRYSPVAASLLLALMAVLSGGALRSNVISSQFFHSAYGGVVPELASRAHLRSVVPIVHEALERLAIVGVVRVEHPRRPCPSLESAVASWARLRRDDCPE